MYIGLWNLEPKIKNTAMMKVSGYYKDHEHNVEVYNSVKHRQYDKIYVFSLFDFTPKPKKITHNMICGGTGFNVKSKLPKEIARYIRLDYSIFPDCTTSYVWFSRGCIRNCPFCIVRKKEGKIQSTWETSLNPNGKTIDVMDNNFFANPEWRKAIYQLKEWKMKVNFHGVDVRLLNEEKIKALLSLKHYKNIKIAWDDPKINLVPVFKNVLKYIKGWRFHCYVLIGFNSTPKEDLYRIETLRNLKIDPFVMPYDKNNNYQKAFARWVNHKAVWRKVPWKDYKQAIKLGVVNG